MKYTVQKSFSNVDRDCLGAGYEFYDNLLEGLLYQMRDRIGRLFIGEEHHNLKFIMNAPFYHMFCIVCQTTGHDSDMFRGVRITMDRSLNSGVEGIVRLVYEEYKELDVKSVIDFWPGPSKIKKGFYRLPHIDHVKFNGPATIVFWKDGTKTVVKHDGKGRKDKKQAILYAFIRKIYGEGRPYHNILNEIEEAVK